jgi:hypothetical protein
VNATADDPSDTIGTAFSTVTLTFSGEPTKGLRLVMHKAGDPDETTYCYDNIASGKDYEVTKFNTSCWDMKGESLTVEDTTKIDKSGLQVSSTSKAITVTELCLEEIAFGAK